MYASKVDIFILWPYLCYDQIIEKIYTKIFYSNKQRLSRPIFAYLGTSDSSGVALRAYDFCTNDLKKTEWCFLRNTKKYILTIK